MIDRNGAERCSLIDDARAFLGLSFEEACLALGDEAEAVSGNEYGRMQNLVSLEDRRVFPGTLYLENNRVELVRLDQNGLMGYTRDVVDSHCRDQPRRLPSPAGKRAHLLVHAREGVAYSYQEDILHFLEVFTPCTQGEYEVRIYRKPAPFIR